MGQDDNVADAMEHPKNGAVNLTKTPLPSGIALPDENVSSCTRTPLRIVGYAGFFFSRTCLSLSPLFLALFSFLFLSFCREKASRLTAVLLRVCAFYKPHRNQTCSR